MAKPKAKTHIQQLGFFDQDLKSNSHDQIMFWLHENINKVLNELYYKKFDVFDLPSMIDKVQGRINDQVPTLMHRNRYKSEWKEKEDLFLRIQDWTGEELIDQDWTLPRIDSDKIEWEHCVERTGRNPNDKFTIGFVDMHVTYRYFRNVIGGIPYSISRLSAYSYPHKCLEDNYDSVCFEVKSKIESVGALMRQINLYKSYKPGKYVVVSPDDRYRNILLNQGVGFVKAFAS